MTKNISRYIKHLTISFVRCYYLQIFSYTAFKKSVRLICIVCISVTRIKFTMLSVIKKVQIILSLL